MRGRVAQAMGDGGAADRWFAEAVRQGPRLSMAYAEWGRSLAQRRQYNAAEIRLKKAIALAPNWVDPVKYWGDALASQGKNANAIRRYDAAIKLAPNWLELRRARQRLSRAS
jgi:tetratricopeptide (TPR) repeat protein